MCHLRVGRTYLKADSFSIGLSDSDRCECGQKETLSHFFLALFINHNKIFYLVKSMKSSHNLPNFPTEKSVQYLFMAITSLLKNLIVEIYLFSMQSKHTLLQQNVFFRQTSHRAHCPFSLSKFNKI